ncbi:hypothetical protein AMTRI_Chr06g170400 [Amborella trichopoda]
MAAMQIGWAAALAFVVCVAASAEASIYRMIATTTTTEEGAREHCRQERRSLNACRRFTQSTRPRYTLLSYKRDIPQRCCEQLQNIEGSMYQGEGERGEQQEMIERAEQLPLSASR